MIPTSILTTKPWLEVRPRKLTSGILCISLLHLWIILVYWMSRVNIVSEAFKSKMQPARHRMVYALLKDEMAAEGGIHALQLRTRTPEEEAKANA